MSDSSPNFDATEFAGGSFVKKDDLMAGPQRFTIEGVSKVTFEARNGRPAQDVLQLDFDEERKFSLNKTNTKLLLMAFGRNTSEWVGKEIVLHHDPNIMFAGNFVGGVRVQIPPAVADMQRDIAEAMPTVV